MKKLTQQFCTETQKGEENSVCVSEGGGGEVGVGREFHQSVLNLTITSHFHDGLPTTLKVTSLLPGIQSYHMFSV